MNKKRISEYNSQKLYWLIIVIYKFNLYDKNILV